MTPTVPLVVITPARDEAERLPRLAASIERQTALPRRWVIVDDASTDETWAAARRIARDLPFAVATRHESTAGPGFARKVAAFESGHETLAEVDHEYVAVLDADVVLPTDYFERSVGQLRDDPRCGLTGGRYRTPHGRLGRASDGWVPGPAQVFRAAAFAEVGGFDPLPHGGEDALIVHRLRKHGWTVTPLDGVVYDHGREMGSRTARTPLGVAVELGRRDWGVGNPLVFEIAKCARFALEQPLLLGALARGVGFAAASLVDRPRLVDDDTLAFIRDYQRQRLVPGRRGRSQRSAA